MKKSKLLALGLASLVGLAGCGDNGGSSQPSGPVTDAKAVIEGFVVDLLGQKKSDIDITSELELADMFSDWETVDGYQYYGEFFTTKTAEDFFTVKEFYDEFNEEDPETGKSARDVLILDNDFMPFNKNYEYYYEGDAQYSEQFMGLYVKLIEDDASGDTVALDFFFAFVVAFDVTEESLLELYADDIEAGEVTEQEIVDYFAEMCESFKTTVKDGVTTLPGVGFILEAARQNME